MLATTNRHKGYKVTHMSPDVCRTKAAYAFLSPVQNDGDGSVGTNFVCRAGRGPVYIYIYGISSMHIDILTVHRHNERGSVLRMLSASPPMYTRIRNALLLPCDVTDMLQLLQRTIS